MSPEEWMAAQPKKVTPQVAPMSPENWLKAQEEEAIPALSPEDWIKGQRDKQQEAPPAPAAQLFPALPSTRDQMVKTPTLDLLLGRNRIADAKSEALRPFVPVTVVPGQEESYIRESGRPDLIQRLDLANKAAQQEFALINKGIEESAARLQSDIKNQDNYTLKDAAGSGVSTLGLVGDVAAHLIDRGLAAIGAPFLPEPWSGGKKPTVEDLTRDTQHSLERSAARYMAMPKDPDIKRFSAVLNSDPQMGFFASTGKLPDAFSAMRHPMEASGRFVAGQMISSLPGFMVGAPIGGAGVAKVVEKMAISSALKSGLTMAGAGAFGNSTAVLFQGYGTNYAEARSKGMSHEQSLDYARTKTLAEIPPNFLAGLALGVKIGGPLTNIPAQATIQGTGGAAGAATASLSVGEKPNNAELWLEFLGEFASAPADILLTDKTQLKKVFIDGVLSKIDRNSAAGIALRDEVNSIDFKPLSNQQVSDLFRHYVTQVQSLPPQKPPVVVPHVPVQPPPEEPVATTPVPPQVTPAAPNPAAETTPVTQTVAPVVVPEPQPAPEPAPAPTEVTPGMVTTDILAEPQADRVMQQSEPEPVVQAPVHQAQPPAPPLPPTLPPPVTPQAPPAAPEKPTENAVSGMQIVEVPLSTLRLSNDVPQFKIGATAKGIVEPLGGKYERVGVAPIQVWRRLDGSLEVISGRHRLDLARRSGEVSIPAQIHDEAAGFNKIQAATLDAELNIRDGQGKVKDYVNYFKESGVTQDAAESKGLLARSTGKRAFTVANLGSDELVAAVRGDQIGDEAAYFIALNAPNDSRLQAVGLRALADGKSMATAINIMQAVKALAVESDTTTDMFGFDDSAMKEAAAMANVASRRQREIQSRLSTITGAARNPELAKTEGIDVRDPEAVRQRIAELKQTKAAWDNWSTNPDLIAEIRQARGAAAPALTLRGETEAEIKEREANEAKRVDAEKTRRAVDAERDYFTLQPQTAEQETPPTGDMFAGTTSAEYQGALEVARRASQAFSKAQEAYRKQEISDEDFISARRLFEKAQETMDAAERKEQGAPAKDATRAEGFVVYYDTAEEDLLRSEYADIVERVERVAKAINAGRVIELREKIPAGRRAISASKKASGHTGIGKVAGGFDKEQDVVMLSAKTIRLNKLSDADIAEFIAHEVEHANQYSRGDHRPLSELEVDAYAVGRKAREEYIATEARTDITALPTKAKTEDVGEKPRFYKDGIPSSGFVRLPKGSDRAYKDAGGKEYVTFERDGVRVAFSSNNILFEDNGKVIEGYGEPEESILKFIGVDNENRGRGNADAAMRDITRAADESGTTLYIEPVSLDKSGMSTTQLVSFYKKHGFEQTKSGSDKVLVRNQKADTVQTGESVMVARYGDKTDTKMRDGDNGAGASKPYKERAGAIAFIYRNQLNDSHEVVEVPGGFVARPVESDTQGKIEGAGETGATDKEVKDTGKVFKDAEDSQEEDDFQVTHIFDSPAKDEVVRLEQKRDFLTVGEARNRIAEWKKNAAKQGSTRANNNKVVLSLFDLTGQWSKPWVEAGYQVYRFDIQDNWTMTDETSGEEVNLGDVNNFSVEYFNDLFGDFEGADIHAILAACPCTDFASSGARHWAAKDTSGQTFDSVDLVRKTLATIEYYKPAVWAVENPVGRIEKLAGMPPWRLAFNPYMFGDPYTKKTLIWGRFNADLPTAAVEPVEGSKMHRLYGGKSQATKNARSVTPEGFAYAFFQANNAADHPAMTLSNIYGRLEPSLFQRALDAGISEESIRSAIDDHYYQDLDDDAAETAIGMLIRDKAGDADSISLFNVSPKKTRAEKISQYAGMKRRLSHLVKVLAKGEAGLDTQRMAIILTEEANAIKSEIDSTKPPQRTAADFLARAAKAYADGDISREVFDVIQATFEKEPHLLEGLRLSIKSPPNGVEATGRFNQIARIISLYKGTGGAEDPQTIRHELSHALEQMMSPEQRKVVVEQWKMAFARAMNSHTDEKHQKFFQSVLRFVANPTNENLKTAVADLPSYEMYQYVNPSEYWAVNAEGMLSKHLGGAWQRFKLTVSRLYEGLKKVLGVKNNYDTHKVFKDLMSGDKKRLDTGMVVELVKKSMSHPNIDLQNIQDDKDLLDKYKRPHTPMPDNTPVKSFLLDVYKNGKTMFIDAVHDPKSAIEGSGKFVMDGLLYLRNTNIWYGAGLEARDFAKYGGALKTSQDIATSSLALDNAIHSGNIGIEVIFRGGLKFNPAAGRYVAVERAKGMTGVYKAEASLKKRLGDQLATDMINGYLEAKRSLSIMNELYEREAEFEAAKDALDMAKKGHDQKLIAAAERDLKAKADGLSSISKAVESVSMSEDEISDFIDRDSTHPELREILENFTAVNQNLLKVWLEVGLLSASRYKTLSGIQDYVPWYRIMNDEEDVHSQLQSNTKMMTNIGKEKLFKRGKPIAVVDFRAKAGQKDFKIQPSSVVRVKVNGKVVPQGRISITQNGEVRINMALQEDDLVVFETHREIENIIDNMTRNVMRMTMNAIRQYAAQRIVSEYASRDADDKIMTFPGVDRDHGRFNFVADGRKVVVEIQDPIVAASIYGMENINLEMWKPLAVLANLTRRTITLSGAFQINQVIKDAPTAALVSNTKNPAAVLAAVPLRLFTSLVQPAGKWAGVNIDPTVDILKAAGIGGFHSPARTPEAEIKRRIGVLNHGIYQGIIKGLDHIGDSSDMAQRIAIYNRVMSETGDEAQALYQAANVINFMHHGSAGYAQAVVRTVAFFGAFLNSMDVLINSLMGGGLRGTSRTKALARLSMTASMLIGLTILYAMIMNADDDYREMDDQTKLKNLFIPGTDIKIPINTSAAWLWKMVPEALYNYYLDKSTDNEQDRRRLRTALADSARDALLGPEPIPTGIKPALEVVFDHSTFTGRSVTPQNLQNVEAVEQYTAATSELGKILSGYTQIPGTDKRVVNPIEADHLVRGVLGLAGTTMQWVSNKIEANSRVAPEAKEQPLTGRFARDAVPRGNEDLFYDFKADVEKRYKTYKILLDREGFDAADEYIDKHGDIVAMYKYITKTDKQLGRLNKEIRRIGETKDPDMTPDERREEINDLKRIKQEILEPVKDMRLEIYGP